jgi:pyruvate/2-oxoglutarate/acetoin dehydrogenase E1 component
MRVITYREAIIEAMREEMRRDKYLFLIGEDVGPYGGEHGLSQGLWEEFGDLRVKDAPISEAAIVGCALGAAITGCRAIAEIPFCDFVGVCMDQIYNQAAKIKYMYGGRARVSLVIRTTIGGYVSGAAQHSQCLEAWFNHVPGLKLVMPSTPYDAKGLLKSAIRDNNPVMVFEHKKLLSLKGEVPEEDYTVPLGTADIKREGKDVTIVATSYMVYLALKAAEKLSKEGIDAEIIDPRTLVPLDEGIILASVKKTGKAVIVYESWKRNGAGAEISSIIAEKAFDYLDAPVLRVAAEDVPIPFSPVLENFVLPSEEKIIKTVKSLF